MVTIRRATASADDATSIARVHVASWQWAYAGLLPDDVLAGLSVPERAARWRDILSAEDAGVTFVAGGPAGAVGFVSVGPGREDVGRPGVGELYALYVHPAVAGTGVGRRLHDHGLAWLGSGGLLPAHLWLLDGNERARRFYERCGWRPDGVTKREAHPDGFEMAVTRWVWDRPVPASA